MKSIKVIYCVHDTKSNSLDGFMMFDNDAQALRAFATTCEQNEVFKKWPEDFEFVKLGDINELGKIDQIDNRTVAKAINYVRTEKAVQDVKEKAEQSEKK